MVKQGESIPKAKAGSRQSKSLLYKLGLHKASDSLGHARDSHQGFPNRGFTHFLVLGFFGL